MKFEGMGLVCVGSVNQSFLARTPALLTRLGPIKSSSYRVARQICNRLNAGHATSHYSALDGCPVVWVFVAEANLDRTLRDLVAQTPFPKAPGTQMVVLCGCARDSLAPSPLRSAELRVASLNEVPSSREKIFVAEGHRDTVRMLRGVLAEDKRKLIELKPGTKPLFFAGVHAGAPLLLPWIAAGMECLRMSGFTRAEAATVGGILGVQALHSYSRAGAKAWNPRATASLRRAVKHDLPAIRSLNPRLAELYEKGIEVALAAFDTREPSEARRARA